MKILIQGENMKNEKKVKIDEKGNKYYEVSYKFVSGKGYVLADPDDKELQDYKKSSLILNLHRKKS